MTDYKVIVDKSTVPVGTAEKVHAAITQISDFVIFRFPVRKLGSVVFPTSANPGRIA